MFRQLLFAVGVATVAHSAVLPERSCNHTGAWSLAQFSSLITFGDSYTDENRLNYFIQNGGAAPPPGTLLPEVSTASTYLVETFGTQKPVVVPYSQRWTNMASLRNPVHSFADHSLQLCGQWCSLLQ